MLAWAGSIAATALVVAAATVRMNRTVAAPPPRVELQINPPASTRFLYSSETVHFAVSPDGQRLAFITSGPGSTRRVWLRSLSSLRAEPVAGTDGAGTVFWSPDSRSIGFVTGDTLKRLQPGVGSTRAGLATAARLSTRHRICG